MFLQLHDNGTMSQRQTYPNVPNLQLPEMMLISQRQILTQAVEEAGMYAINRLQASQNVSQEFPTLQIDSLENFAFEGEEEDFEFQTLNGYMGFSWQQAISFLIRNGKAIYEFSLKFSKTVKLWRVNNRIRSYYEDGYYQVNNLNNLTPKQIDEQLALISGDLLNATANKDYIDSMALSRFSQVYQQRKNMLPAINQRTLLIAGGLLAAYFFIKK